MRRLFHDATIAAALDVFLAAEGHTCLTSSLLPYKAGFKYLFRSKIPKDAGKLRVTWVLQVYGQTLVTGSQPN